MDALRRPGFLSSGPAAWGGRARLTQRQSFLVSEVENLLILVRKKGNTIEACLPGCFATESRFSRSPPNCDLVPGGVYGPWAQEGDDPRRQSGQGEIDREKK